jgi:hypothetical protein
MRSEDLFEGSRLGLVVLDRVRTVLAGLGPFEERASRSQVTFRRRRGFAWLWRPGRYLRRPAADVVLTFALGRPEASSRLKEVVHPSAAHWVHHLEVHDVAEIDDEVVAWLREAADRAG